MVFETLLYEKQDHIVRITMNRPERLNALNDSMRRELDEAWEALKQDDDAHIGIITGAGDRAFNAGLDLKEASTQYAEGRGPALARYHPGPHQIWKPLIAAVNGVACGGGMSIAVECDIIITTPDATFFDPHATTIGFAGPLSVSLPRRIPFHVALRMMLMGSKERLSAHRAYETGLVTEIVPREQLLARATEIAQLLTENSSLVMAAAKEATWRSADAAIEDAQQFLAQHVAAAKKTQEPLEGAVAFVERRRPQW